MSNYGTFAPLRLYYHDVPSCHLWCRYDCTPNKDGVYILDADPSIVCDMVRAAYILPLRRQSTNYGSTMY